MAADADAPVLADGDSSLLPTPIKSEELQALQGLQRIREQWKRARTARICEARASLAEFGISVPLGVRGIGKKLRLATEQAPILIQPTLLDLIRKVGNLEQRLQRVDQALAEYAKATVALADKMARIMWAVWTRHEAFNGNDALRFAA